MPRTPAALALAAAVILLSGCGAPTPSPTTTADPSAGPISPPQTSLPLGCEQVIATDVVSAALVAPVELLFDESSTPLTIRGAEFAQGGGLSCIWTGDAADTGLQLTVAAATADEFDFGVPSRDGAVLDTLGDRSVLECSVPAGGYACSADMLVTDYWINAVIADTGDGFTVDSALATATTAFSQVVESVLAAGAPRAAWSPPSDAFNGITLCSDPTSIAAVFDVDPGLLSVRIDPNPLGGAFGLAVSHTPTANCLWSVGEASVLVETLQGGAWWTDMIAAAPPAEAPNYSPPMAMDVPGTDAAYLAGNGTGSVIILSTDGTVVALTTQQPLDAGVAASLATAFAATLQ